MHIKTQMSKVDKNLKFYVEVGTNKVVASILSFCGRSYGTSLNYAAYLMKPDMAVDKIDVPSSGNPLYVSESQIESESGSLIVDSADSEEAYYHAERMKFVEDLTWKAILGVYPDAVLVRDDLS